MTTQFSAGPSKSLERRAFERYLRYGIVDSIPVEEKHGYNPYRAEDGRFDFAPGHGTLSPRGEAAGLGRGAGRGNVTQSVKPVARPRAAPPPRPQSPRPSGLSNEVVAAAQAAERQHGVPTAITLAQYGLESGWGRRMPPGSNNPFGIKARPGEPFVLADTWEQDRNGRIYRIKAKFRKYNSLSDAFIAYARLLRSPTYARAQAARNSDDYADALTGVYATDRKYGSKLKSLIRQHGLNGFNTGGAAR